MVDEDWWCPTIMSDTYAAAVSCLLSAFPAWQRVHLHPHLNGWQGFCFVRICDYTYEYAWALGVRRKGGTACPNSGSSITLVQKDSEGQGGAKEEGTAGRKGSDVNESSYLSCHVRSKAVLSLSSTCACVCALGISAVMSYSVAQRSLSSLMACLQAARSGHFTSMWGTCLHACREMRVR